MENCRGMQPRVTTCIDDSLWIKGEGGALAIKYYERSSTDRSWIRSLPSSSFLIIKSKRKANSIFFFKIVSRCNRPVKKKKKIRKAGIIFRRDLRGAS